MTDDVADLAWLAVPVGAAVSLGAFLALVLAGGDAVGGLLAAALLGPPSAVVAGLVVLAGRVGSRADDPEEVEARLAEGLGVPEREFDDRFDRHGGSDPGGYGREDDECGREDEWV